MRHILRLVAVAAVIGAASPALASGSATGGSICADVPRTLWLPHQTVKAKLTEIGFDVRGMKAKSNCYEVKGTDKLGFLVKMYVDPMTAEVVIGYNPESHE
jgi:hypothetical protein